MSISTNNYETDKYKTNKQPTLDSGNSTVRRSSRIMKQNVLPLKALTDAREYDLWMMSKGAHYPPAAGTSKTAQQTPADLVLNLKEKSNVTASTRHNSPTRLIASSFSPQSNHNHSTQYTFSAASASLPVAGSSRTASTGGALLGSVTTQYVFSAAPASLPAAGSSRTASTGGALLGSVTQNSTDNTQSNFSAASASLPVAGYSGTASTGGALLGSVTTQNSTNTTLPQILPTSSPLFILQWNINGFFKHMCDLEILVKKYSPTILAIQEIHRATTTQLNRTMSRRYRWTFKQGGNVYQSVGIGILSHLPFVVIPTPTDLPIVAIKIKCPIAANVVSCYLPSPTIKDLRDRLKAFLASLEEPIIFLGDVNGHHPAWGKHPPNKRGHDIMDAAESCNLILLNDGSPTYTKGSRESSVDVSFASANILNRLLWYISDDPLGSDHHPIGLQLDTAPHEITRRPRWVYRDADWLQYQQLITSKCREETPHSIATLTETIFQAASESIPRTSSIPGKKALNWWSSITKTAVRDRRKALRAVKRLPINHPNKEAALEHYRTKRNLCRDTIRKAKDESWENFIDTVNPNQSTSDLWAKVNALSGKRRAKGMVIEHDGECTQDPDKIVNLLGEYFARLSSINEYSNEFERDKNPTTTSIRDIIIPDDKENNDFNQPFRLDELTLALSKAKGKSAGQDEVGYPLIKNLPASQQILLLELINKEWTQNSFPNEWKHSLVIPIKKPDSPAQEISSYRPISLTCCTSKIMERMINRRLTVFLEEGNFLDHRQHAFRPGHGTNSYFGQLSQALYDAFEKRHHTELITLDLSKAYNRAWMPDVLEQLKTWGLNGHIMNFLKNFLINRTFQVILGNQRSKIFAEETGIPQGSVIAVTLFLIRMNGVFDELPIGIFIFVYADDIVLMVPQATAKALRRKLTEATNQVTKWANSAGFQLTGRKSEYIHLCPRRHKILNTPIQINGETVPRKKNLRVLGVRLDQKLTFDPHFDEVRENCKSRLNLLKALAGRHQHANRNTRLKIGNVIINSRLIYGLEITFLNYKQLIKRLEPIYQRMIRISSGLLPCTPGLAACAESGQLPFEKYITKMICYRAICLHEKTTGTREEDFLLIEANRLLIETTNQELPLVSKVHWCGTRSWNLPKIKIDKSIKNSFKAGCNPNAVSQSVAELQRRKYDGYNIRYTDGSIANNRVGIGVTGPLLKESYQLRNQCTIFSAEAAAAFIAATYPSTNPIVIFTDSASIIAALEMDTCKHSWIQAIQKYAPPNTVFVWIPGHCGIRGNIEADHLAALGRRGTIFTRRVPGSDLKTWVSKQIENAWATQWDNVGRAGTRDFFLRKIKNDISKWNDSSEHHTQVVLSRLRTGYTRLSHSFDGHSDFKTKCNTCNTHNTVEHILCRCPLYYGLREKYKLSGSIREILNPSNEEMLIRFLKDSSLFKNI